MLGDGENFARQDSVEAAWRVVDPILDNVTPAHPYAPGTWGPVEADALLPITDLDAAKTALRSIQDRWDRAGKVPRADIERVEKAMRRVETAVREAEEKKWKASNPEVAARANSMVTQLESSLATLRDDLAKAEAKGSAAKVADLTSRIQAQEQWLAQARAGLDEFGG